jgi:short subunit dehydrogenase-like uncharacterized protein
MSRRRGRKAAPDTVAPAAQPPTPPDAAAPAATDLPSTPVGARAAAPTWMLYGANGYTGRLVLDEALRRGLRPILAGRSAPAVEALAREHGLPARSFDLAHPATVRAGLNGVALVLHCAGPFSATAAPMLEACLAVGAHYVDITGEIDVFAHCHAQDARARERGIAVVPGAGFDVVPTDSLAALLARELPGARELVLAFDAGGGPSPGTARTAVEGLGRKGRVRRGGELAEVPLAWKDRTFERDGAPRTAMTIPWGDVYTAFVTTGVPDIEVYMAVPPSTVTRLRRWRWLAPAMAWPFVRRKVAARAAARPGPDAARRESTAAHVWGEIRDATGRERRLELATPNGYALTAWTAVGIAQRLLDGPAPPGYATPAQLMGADWILGMPGVRLIDREANR